MEANERVQLTKDLIDHVLGKIPGSFTRAVQIDVSWKSVEVGDGDDLEIVPSVKLSWGEVKQ